MYTFLADVHDLPAAELVLWCETYTSAGVVSGGDGTGRGSG